MKNMKKHAAATGIIAATLALGGAGIAMAANADPAEPTSATTNTEDSSFTGTVAAPPETAPDAPRSS